MKRIFSLFLSLVLLCPLFAACHGGEGQEEFEMPLEFDESVTHEISFWAKNDTNITQMEIYKKAIADFEALYPNVKVSLKPYTDYGRLYQDVITNIATNTTPNVCITYPDHIATYKTGANTVVELDSLMEDPRYGLGGSELRFDSVKKEEIIPKFLEECILDGAYYALPYMRSTEICYVNRSFVEKLGYTLPETLTWDFIWEVSEKAAEKDAEGVYKINGQKVMLPFLYKSTDNMMITYLKQAGAGYSTPEGKVEIFNETTEDFLFEIAEHTGKGAFSTFKISGYPANFLNAGQCIFAIDSSAGATWMGSDAPLVDIAEEKMVEFETEVMTIPQIDPEHPAMISQGPSVCVFNKEDPQEVLASWLFAQFLLTNEVQIAYSQTEGYAPVTSKAQESEKYQSYLNCTDSDDPLYYPVKLRATKLLIENTENTFVTPVFNGSASLRDAAGSLVESVTKNVRRKKTVDAAFMEKLYHDTTSLYRLDQIRLVQPVEKTDGGEPEESLEAVAGKADVSTPLPLASKALLLTLAGVWILLAAGWIWGKLRKKP
ncbi:MAG: extracellular solute-binding protein [Clostridia bacterium]|nr:extracellular solute-binding protein [Clostridia bacterium]